MANPPDQRKLIYALLCCAVVTINFNLAAAAAVIPLIGRDFGLPDVAVSRIISWFMIPYGLCALIYAPLTRVLTYRAALVTALALYAASCLVCSLSASLTPLLWGSALMGLSAAGVIPLGLMVIGDLFPKEMRGRLVGMFFSTSFFASLAGVALSGIMHWRWLFYVPIALGLITLAGLCVLPTRMLAVKHSAPVNYIRVITDTRIRNVFIFIFIISFLYHGVHKWYGVFLSREYGLDKLAVSFFFMLSALSGGLGQNVGGYITDKKGRLTACSLGGIVLSVAVMLLAGRYPLYILAGIIALISVGWTINHNSISTVLTDFPEDDRPMLASLNSSVRFVSGGWGFSLSSLFVAQSFSWTFLGIGALMFVTVLFLKRLISQH